MREIELPAKEVVHLFEARIKTLGDESRTAWDRSRSQHHYSDAERDDMKDKAKALGFAAQQIRKVLDGIK